MEIEVLAVSRKFVESLDGLREIAGEIGRELQIADLTPIFRKPLADPARQLLDGRRLDDMVVFFARRDDEAAIFAARGIVLAALVPDGDEDEIRIFAERGIPFEEGLGGFIVGEFLVGDASAVLVDVDHRVAGWGEGADQRGVMIERLLQYDRAHPGIVHIAQLRADRCANVYEIPFVGDRGAAAEHRRAEEVLAHVDVMRETAGREYDGLARTDRDRFAVGAVRFDADNIIARVADYPLHAHSRADFNAVAPRRLGHCAHSHFAAVRHRVAGALR